MKAVLYQEEDVKMGKVRQIQNEDDLLSSQAHLMRDLRSLLPNDFTSGIEEFKSNNSLAVTYSLQGYHEIHCCEQCLKAHAFKIADDLGLDRNLLLYLDMLFPCETGHDGYYLDEEQLVKI